MSFDFRLSAGAMRARLALAVMTVSMVASPIRAQDTDQARAVLVTGSSSGIGLRMTEVLSENGFYVYAGARTAEDLARLDAMQNVTSVRLDVTEENDIDAAVEFVRAEGRGLYGLINNAGVAVIGPLIELSAEDMDFQLDVNLLGPYRVTQAFADLLIESRGRVMTVSSIAGILSGPFSGAYSMSKHGVEAFTDALAAELDRFDVAVAAVEPGNYKSQITASMVRRMQETGYSAEGSRYGSMLALISGPLDRSQFAEPDAVALAALDFLSTDAPRRRYMVVPTRNEAEITIRQALRELVELNAGHRFSYSRDELVRMLDDALGEPVAPSPDGPASVGLHQAAAVGDLAAVRRQIAAGADLNAREPSGGSSPLITAATFGHADVARALIAAGADLDQRNNDGSTALLTAAFFCRTEIVAALLTAGADKSIRNNAGSTALDVVTAPFDAVRGIYDFVGAALAPYGLKLDYERIETTRPTIADMLR
ncbi:MAG: SDR family NAD(P)-dependent oxidoreductase [Gemmatimonadota bacterium]|nr:SDR family NAD(P)-dependent oxidoreductase [Gemmatimonadota bacterium]MDH5198142.1 SDR family NAD(P)-dependent oxidoreductase [Gemmatimonadota bacterium]